MNTYLVCTTGESQWFSIENSRPEGAVAPKTEGCMRYIPGEGFQVTMRCYEQDPAVSYTQPDDPVCKDSCMECFLKCFADSPDYINVEVNSAGVMKCGFGPGRERNTVRGLGFAQPKVTVTKNDAYWQINYVISEGLLESLYQRPCRFAAGHEMQGNFYKCREEVLPPHWASWSKVERLDFHTPEFFGQLKIV